MSAASRHIHLSGICGTAMASLAGLLQLRGHRITGSDKAAYPPMSDLLCSLGIPILEPYAEANLDPAPDLVVIGNALSRGNPEVERVLDERHEAADAAAQIVLADVEKYLTDQRARGAAAIVSELREYFDEVVETEIAKREGELGELDEEQREKVRSLIRSVVAKIAHRPTVALKEAAGTDQGIRLNEATRSLFDL